MARLAFLTPDNLSGDQGCFPLYIPGHLLHYAIGALAELTSPGNWEKFGDVEPLQAAEYFDERLLAFVSTPCPESTLPTPYITGRLDDDIELTTGVFTTLPWTSVSKVDAYFDVDIGTGEITIIEPGNYAVSIFLPFEPTTLGIRRIRAVWDQGSIIHSKAPAGGDVTTINLSFGLRLVTGNQTLHFEAYQNSGSTRDVLASNASWGPVRFQIFYLG